MEFSLVKLLELFLLPPGSLIVLFTLGLFCLRYSVRLGVGVIAFTLFIFYLLCTPFIAAILHDLSSPYEALTEEQISNNPSDAIVVLGGGRLRQQWEYGSDTVGRFTLQRIRYGAWLKRRTYLPLYVSGGKFKGDLKSEAELMQDVLQREFNVDVYAMENESKTTYENAKFTAKLLKKSGHKNILLVSHAAHMPRAVEAFEHFDIMAIPAPTVYKGLHDSSPNLKDFLPQGFAFSQSYFALHEIIGRYWYWIRYY